MKKKLLVCCFLLIGAVSLMAEDIGGKVKAAVNGLAAPLNKSIEVSVGEIFYEGVNPSALSRSLSNWIITHAPGTGKFTVVAPSRGIPKPGSPQKAVIKGKFWQEGNVVHVVLQLVEEPSGTVRSSQNFTLSAPELKKDGIEVQPERISIPQEETIFPPVVINPPEKITNPASIIIKAWPNSDTNTYVDGDFLDIKIVANKSCFFKVYHVDVNNDMQLIHPINAGDNELKANVERTIGGGNFKISAPYGQDTIVVVASTRQFTNIEPAGVPLGKATSDIMNSAMSSRGVSLKVVEPAQTAETVSVRFNFTSLPATYYDEVYSYPKPDNVKDAIQAIRADVLKQGGTFNGNEREGTFSVSGTLCNYRITGDTFTMYIRYTGNQFASRSRGAGFSFSMDKPGDLRQAVQAIRNGIEKKGGIFNGNEQQGNFQASGIVGQYRVSNKVTVTITEKPLYIPGSLIEKEVKNYFAGK